jgi:protein-tyrosine-phosphatase
MLADIDLVVVMERAHERKLQPILKGRDAPVILLGDLDPVPPDRREIQDPWGHPDEVFRDSFARIDRCLTALVQTLTSTE